MQNIRLSHTVITGRKEGRFKIIIGGLSVANTIVYVLFFISLAAISVSDIDTMEIPDRYHLFIFLLGVGKLFLYPERIMDLLLGAVVVSIPMLIITIFTGGFGGADIKLMAVVGFFLGTAGTIICFFTAVLSAGCVGVVLLLRWWIFERSYKSKIPFCPAIALGCVVAVFFGNNIFNWYVDLLR